MTRLSPSKQKKSRKNSSYLYPFICLICVPLTPIFPKASEEVLSISLCPHSFDCYPKAIFSIQPAIEKLPVLIHQKTELKTQSKSLASSNSSFFYPSYETSRVAFYLNQAETLSVLMKKIRCFLPPLRENNPIFITFFQFKDPTHSWIIKKNFLSKHAFNPHPDFIWGAVRLPISSIKDQPALDQGQDFSYLASLEAVAHSLSDQKKIFFTLFFDEPPQQSHLNSIEISHIKTSFDVAFSLNKLPIQPFLNPIHWGVDLFFAQDSNELIAPNEASILAHLETIAIPSRSTYSIQANLCFDETVSLPCYFFDPIDSKSIAYLDRNQTVNKKPTQFSPSFFSFLFDSILPEFFEIEEQTGKEELLSLQPGKENTLETLPPPLQTLPFQIGYTLAEAHRFTPFLISRDFFSPIDQDFPNQKEPPKPVFQHALYNPEEALESYSIDQAVYVAQKQTTERIIHLIVSVKDQAFSLNNRGNGSEESLDLFDYLHPIYPSFSFGDPLKESISIFESQEKHFSLSLAHPSHLDHPYLVSSEVWIGLSKSEDISLFVEPRLPNKLFKPRAFNRLKPIKIKEFDSSFNEFLFAYQIPLLSSDIEALIPFEESIFKPKPDTISFDFSENKSLKQPYLLLDEEYAELFKRIEPSLFIEPKFPNKLFHPTAFSRLKPIPIKTFTRSFNEFLFSYQTAVPTLIFNPCLPSTDFPDLKLASSLSTLKEKPFNLFSKNLNSNFSLISFLSVATSDQDLVPYPTIFFSPNLTPPKLKTFSSSRFKRIKIPHFQLSFDQFLFGYKKTVAKPLLDLSIESDSIFDPIQQADPVLDLQKNTDSSSHFFVSLDCPFFEIEKSALALNEADSSFAFHPFDKAPFQIFSLSSQNPSSSDHSSVLKTLSPQLIAMNFSSNFSIEVSTKFDFPLIKQSAPSFLSILEKNESQEDSYLHPPLIQSKNFILSLDLLKPPLLLPSLTALSSLPSLEELDTYILSTQFRYETEVIAEPHGEGYYFAVKIIPFSSEDLRTLSQNVFFVLDQSRSLSEERFEAFKKSILRAIPYLGRDTRFNIVILNKHLEMLSKTLLPYEPDTLEQAKNFLSKISYNFTVAPQDYSRLFSFFDETFPSPDSMLNTVILLSDGAFYKHFHTKKDSIAEICRKNKNRYHLYTVAAGQDNYLGALDTISFHNQGELLYSKTQAALPRQLAILVKNLRYPKIHRLHLSPLNQETAHVQFFSEKHFLSTLFADKPVTIYGKTDKLENLNLMIQGRVDEEWVNIRFDLDLRQAMRGNRELLRNCQQMEKKIRYFQDPDPSEN